MRITPTTHMLAGLTERPHISWTKLVGELIDNSIDAGATEVVVEFRGDSLSVHDNGSGIEDVSLLFRIGHRSGHGRPSTGRYGWGAKDALLLLGYQAKVETVRDGIETKFEVNWQAIGDDWETGSDPVAVEVNSPSYTKITAQRLRRRRPPKEAFMEGLGQLYYPAMCQGNVKLYVQFNRRPELVPARSRPKLDDERCWANESIVIIGGMIRHQEDRKRQGVTVVLEQKRVVESGQRYGLPPATPGLFFEVTLRGPTWAIAKNKDGLSEKDRKRIGDHIAEHFADMIEGAAKAGENLQIQAINAELQIVASNALANRKAKRKPPVNETGTVEPKRTGIRHGRADRTQPGSTFTERCNRNRNGITVSVQELGESSPVVSLSGDSTVIFNSNTEAFAKLFQSGEGMYDVTAINLVALTYFTAATIINERLELLPFAREMNQAEAMTISVDRLLGELAKLYEGCEIRTESTDD